LLATRAQSREISDFSIFDNPIYLICRRNGRGEQVWIQPKEYKRVGRILAAARQATGITQVGLAKKLRKPQSFVSSYEIGQRRIDVLELVRIANVLGVDAVALLKEIVAGR
jgi:ribosome-binding protein aMBF1 (putative translation factor)